VLTPAGGELAARLFPAFAGIAEAVTAARAGAHREIEISCLGTFGMKWLIPRLPGFLAANPDIRVRMSESHAPVDFTRDRFDGAIRVQETERAPKGQEATAFMPLHQGPIAAPGIAAECASVAALFRQPRLFASTFRDSWREWSERSGHALPPASVEREFAHNHSMIEAAASGLGVAIAPWSFVAPDIAGGRLVAPFGFSERATRFVFIRPASRPDPAVDAFRDWLVAEGQATPIPSTGPVG
jgi:DNA-binding transcriptional LysR family regulator